MPTKKPEKGDKVSWNWGGGAPGGTVAETKEKGEIAIKSKRGNTIKKNASPDNPAVHVERAGNDVVKRASELTVEEKASGNKSKRSNGKRKARTPDTEGGEDVEDEGDNEERKEASDEDDPHTKNKQGKEVKKGGKAANKRQKRRQDEDVRGNIEDSGISEAEEDDDDDDDEADDDNDDNNSEEDEEEDTRQKPKQVKGNKKSANMNKAQTKGNKDESKSISKKSTTKAKKDPAPQDNGDMVSTRTCSQHKSK